jgi:hypothetical protein
MSKVDVYSNFHENPLNIPNELDLGSLSNGCVNIHWSSIIATLKVTLFEGFVVPYGISISFFFQ